MCVHMTVASVLFFVEVCQIRAPLVKNSCHRISSQYCAPPPAFFFSNCIEASTHIL